MKCKNQSKLLLIKVFLPNFAFLNTKSPSVIQRSVSQLNPLKKKAKPVGSSPQNYRLK